MPIFGGLHQPIDFGKVESEDHITENAGRSVQQRVRRIELDVDAGVHHQHTIRVDDGVQAMRDSQYCALGELATNCVLNLCVSPKNTRLLASSRTEKGERKCLLRINVRCCFVKHKNFILPQNCPRETDELPLADAEVSAMRTDVRLEPNRGSS